jgi:hypothetical protein
MCVHGGASVPWVFMRSVSGSHRSKATPDRMVEHNKIIHYNRKNSKTVVALRKEQQNLYEICSVM